ncbi:transmembrane signal receptor [Lithospermum erythrorhizon]|uniref:Transmembrane signal receptor n=1 Tax=Lithospermum erythrorhizon TaxID=34254 RepID=A0AAV3PMI3_LITER
MTPDRWHSLMNIIGNSNPPSAFDRFMGKSIVFPWIFDTRATVHATGPKYEDGDWSRTPSSSGAKYFLTLVDDHSRAVWAVLLSDKTEVHAIFLRFVAMVKRQFGLDVCRVHSDNGTKFLSLNSYFATQGILFKTSCVGTPQQNGRAEIKHRYLLNVARTLMFQGHLSTKFGGECLLGACYLINRTPSRILHFKSPYEILYGSPPSYDNLRVFGCLCYALDLNSRKDKFASRSRKCIFVGYPLDKKGWKLFDLETQVYFVSLDVTFYESEFPGLSDSPELLSESRVLIEEAATTEDEPPFAAAPIVNTEVELSRGQRARAPSSHLRDYVPNSIHHSSPPLSSTSPCFSPSTGVEPRSYLQALRDPGWCDATKAEINALENNGTWSLVELPKHKKALGSRWFIRSSINLMGNIRLHVLIYVDDLIISSNNSAALSAFKDYLSSCFHLKDLGVLKYFLGIEVGRSSEGFYLCQRKYALDIIAECGLLGGRPAGFPMEPNYKLGESTSRLVETEAETGPLGCGSPSGALSGEFFGSGHPVTF